MKSIHELARGEREKHQQVGAEQIHVKRKKFKLVNWRGFSYSFLLSPSPPVPTPPMGGQEVGGRERSMAAGSPGPKNLKRK